jgi:hypothetical protein
LVTGLASAKPSKKRMVRKLHGPTENAVPPDRKRQLIMMRAIPWDQSSWQAAAARANGCRQARY